MEHGTTDQNLGHDTLKMQSQVHAVLPHIMYYEMPAEALAPTVTLDTLGQEASTTQTLGLDAPSQNLGHTWAMDHLGNVQMMDYGVAGMYILQVSQFFPQLGLPRAHFFPLTLFSLFA